MEKICLVKLRKKIINPLLSQGEHGIASQGREQAIPQQFISYTKTESRNTEISDSPEREQGLAQQFISSFTDSNIMNTAVSDTRGNEARGVRQFIALCGDTDMMPHKTVQDITLGDAKKTVPGGIVSLTLTQDQIKTIRSSSSLLSVFSGELAGGVAELDYRNEPVTIKFEYEPLAPIRLLMSEEVVQMLRISNGFLKTIVRDGKLKSYKIGKGRRYMLEDVLAYLEESLYSQGSQQDAFRVETI
jgi:excisionase family DNA binding protein